MATLNCNSTGIAFAQANKTSHYSFGLRGVERSRVVNPNPDKSRDWADPERFSGLDLENFRIFFSGLDLGKKFKK